MMLWGDGHDEGQDATMSHANIDISDLATYIQLQEEGKRKGDPLSYLELEKKIFFS